MITAQGLARGRWGPMVKEAVHEVIPWPEVSGYYTSRCGWRFDVDEIHAAPQTVTCLWCVADRRM